MFRTAAQPLSQSLFGAAKASSRSSMRGYATAPTSNSSSNLGLVAVGAGVAGIGYWLYLGGLDDTSAGQKASDAAQKAKNAAQGATGIAGALSKDKFTDFKLKEIKPYNHDSAIFSFAIPDDTPSGLSVASAVVFRGAGEEGLKGPDGKQVIRPYTPISAPDDKGHIDFLIKKYPNGAMTNHVHDLKVGDSLGIKGPIPKFPYKANEFEEIGMIAGGSGITPMWQVIQQIAGDKSDKTKVTLIYSNKTEKDILLREKFDELAKTDARFKIVYGLDTDGKKGVAAFTGYVTPEVISKHLPAPGKADKVKLFVCGPPPQVESISGGKGPKGSQGELKGLLADAGYQPDQVYKF
ncbi:unnamed protein product [Sympodiomycopsis kandeliae]